MSIDTLFSSGILEQYVIGDISPADKKTVEDLMSQNEIVRNEVLEIEKSFEAFAFANELPTPPNHKAMLFAVLDFQERLGNGEIPINPPSLTAETKISDFSQWLESETLQEPDEYDSLCGKIINSDEEKTTLIIWLKDGAPDEVHTDEYEKFLIVEGECDIVIGDKTHSLKAGDFLSVPLFINHRVEVTSKERCKIILERAVA